MAIGDDEAVMGQLLTVASPNLYQNSCHLFCENV